ncbi:helix-turn-helix transcriptional regulator [filamentous cyanobacterium CCP5]|nr:helix-turn-helix transcriptional regulator [filamentous cyanobacterium CCP5]
MEHSLFEAPSVTSDASLDSTRFSMLQSVIEGLSDGILIVTPAGQFLHMNRRGRDLCRQLSQPNSDSRSPVPDPIWTLCQYLLESQDSCPEHPIVLSDTISTGEGTIRARVQWFQLADQTENCLMVILENETEVRKMAALFEAQQFNLTERETEVWVLRKANRSYEEIARELYIAINTVKRHLKSIYAKRKQAQGLAESLYGFV